MRIKLDENMPAVAVTTLRALGHDVDTAANEGLAGADDPVVLEGATRDGRLLITLDRGLGDIRAYPPGTHAGVFVIRSDHQSPRAVARAISQIGTTIELEDLSRCVSVWRDGELRVRRPPANENDA